MYGVIPAPIVICTQACPVITARVWQSRVAAAKLPVTRRGNLCYAAIEVVCLVCLVKWAA